MPLSVTAEITAAVTDAEGYGHSLTPADFVAVINSYLAQRKPSCKLRYHIFCFIELTDIAHMSVDVRITVGDSEFPGYSGLLPADARR